MGLFGLKSGGKDAVNWAQAIQEAKVQHSRMNDLKTIYHDNKSW